MRSAAGLVWVLAGASALYWGLRIASPSNKTQPTTVSASPVFQADPATVARFLGAHSNDKPTTVSSSMRSRFVLLGVLADKSGAGAALIAADDKPPKPFRVGSEVVPGYQLQSVKSRIATLQSITDNSSIVTLEMVPLKK